MPCLKCGLRSPLSLSFSHPAYLVGGAGLGPKPGVGAGPTEETGVGTDERLLRRTSRTVAMIATAAIASIAKPVGDTSSPKIDSGNGPTRNRTPERTVAFLTLVHVAEFEVVLAGEGVPVGTRIFT